MTLARALPGVAAAVFLCVDAVAATAGAPPDFLEGFKAEDISAILTDAGAKGVTSDVVENEPRLNFTIGETKYIADFYECEDKAKGCRLLQFVVIFEPDANDSVQAVNEFNKKFLYGKAALDRTEGLFSMRMINGTAGSSKAQVKVELASFLGVTAVLLEHMKTSTVAARQPGSGETKFIDTAAPASMSTPLKLKGLAKNRR